MPNGKTHSAATLIAAGSLAAGMYFFAGQPLATTAIAGAGCLAGLLINPDLDVRHSTQSRHLVRQAGGPMLAMAWAGLWWPYAHVLIPYHRHPLSHFPVLGTIIRLGYLFVILFSIWGGLHFFLQLSWQPHLPFTEHQIWIGLGSLVISDTLHTLMDLFWPAS